LVHIRNFIYTKPQLHELAKDLDTKMRLLNDENLKSSGKVLADGAEQVTVVSGKPLTGDA
jgi:hypothetical protein